MALRFGSVINKTKSLSLVEEGFFMVSSFTIPIFTLPRAPGRWLW